MTTTSVSRSRRWVLTSVRRMASTLLVAAPLFGAYANVATNFSAYLTNGADNTVSVINTANNTVVATTPVTQAPLGLAVTPDQTQTGSK